MGASPVFRMDALYAGHGDCLLVEYGTGEQLHRILVDGGTAGTYRRVRRILDRSKNPVASHELLVVTHVDADHIAGVLPVIESENYSQHFREVWFNGRKHLNPGARLESFGAVQGERLTVALEKQNLPWNRTFDGQQVSLSEDGIPVCLPLADGGKVTILSPSWEQLRSLLPQWDKEVTKAGLDPLQAAEQPNKAPPGYEMFGGLDVDYLADTPFEEDNAKANGSSIAMMIEYHGKRLLLAGDAHPSILISSIKKISGGGPLSVDVFKLPHHGSKANVSKELIETVRCKTAVFSTSGAYFSHPDKEAVARVIKYSPRGVELVFNCRTSFNEIWDSDELREEWKYSTRYGISEEGVSVGLL